MTRRAAGAALVAVAALAACHGGKTRGARSAKQLFSPRAVQRFDLEVAPADLAALAAHPDRWVTATFVHGGTRYPDVQLRWQGRTPDGWDGKPTLRLRFDELVAKRRFLDQGELVLDALTADPTGVRAALAYRLYRALGVPAPRTGWAELYINGEARGLYLDVEVIGKRLLRDQLGDDGKGSLYAGALGCDLEPGAAGRLRRLSGPRAPDALEALARDAEAAATGLFAPDGPLDRARVLAYLAVSNLVGDLDGDRHGHDWRLYRDTRAHRWSLLPWGLDRAFKRRPLPLAGDGVLARRCFADAACRADYLSALDRAAGELATMVDEHEPEHAARTIAAAVARDRRWPDKKVSKKARKKLEAFLAERAGEVRDAIAHAGRPGVDADGDGHGEDDCDDRARAVHPGAAEACDGVDRDCSGAGNDSAACACQPVTVGAATFQFCAAPRSWADAETTCVALGGHLARLDDDVAQLQNLAAHIKVAKKARWWIGLSDRATEGTFGWGDGAAPTAARWAEHQPDDGGCGEDCATLADDGTWRDEPCSQRRPFICR